MIRLLFILLCLSLTLAHAEVYRWTNEEGVTVYSDAPPSNVSSEQAQPVDLPKLSTTPPFSRPKAKNQETVSGKKSTDSLYQSLKITYPEKDSAVRANGGNVTISVSLSPGLMVDAGHDLQLYLDGALISSGSNTNFSLQNVSRGEHVAYAQVRDDRDKSLIDSEKVSFTVLRNSILLNNNSN